MDNQTYNREVEDIVERDGGDGDYSFKIAQYNIHGNCIFNAWILGIELETVWALVDHALNSHPLAEFEVTQQGIPLISKQEYRHIEYWKD